MPLGDTVIVDGIEMEIVWSGGLGLVGERATQDTGIWHTTHTRIYNKTGKHKGKFKKKVESIEPASNKINFMGDE